MAILMYFTMGHMAGLPIPAWYHGVQNGLLAALLQFVLALPVVYLNRAFYKNGIKHLLNGSPNMDSLICVGSGSALIYGLIKIFAIGWPGALHVYFDLFSGGIQTYVFCMLTMTYIASACGDAD